MEEQELIEGRTSDCILESMGIIDEGAKKKAILIVQQAGLSIQHLADAVKALEGTVVIATRGMEEFGKAVADKYMFEPIEFEQGQDYVKFDNSPTPQQRSEWRRSNKVLRK